MYEAIMPLQEWDLLSINKPSYASIMLSNFINFTNHGNRLCIRLSLHRAWRVAKKVHVSHRATYLEAPLTGAQPHTSNTYNWAQFDYCKLRSHGMINQISECPLCVTSVLNLQFSNFYHQFMQIQSLQVCASNLKNYWTIQNHAEGLTKMRHRERSPILEYYHRLELLASCEILQPLAFAWNFFYTQKNHRSYYDLTPYSVACIYSAADHIMNSEIIPCVKKFCTWDYRETVPAYDDYVYATFNF